MEAIQQREMSVLKEADPVPTGKEWQWDLVFTDAQCTPWKINTEPTRQPFRKENDHPNLHEDMFHVNLPVCMVLFTNIWVV